MESECPWLIPVEEYVSLAYYSPMERFFRSLKSEWAPHMGYPSFQKSKAEIIRYVTGYYSQVRPHRHNQGLAPNVAETKYWNDYYSVAK